MWLVFERCGAKLYARTPRGEIAFGEHGGLYEWVGGRRVDYSGGDQQVSSDGSLWSPSGASSPVRAGFREAARAWNHLTN